MIGYLIIIIPKRFSAIRSITNVDLAPSMQMQLLVSSLFLLLLACIFILVVLHAIRVKRKALRKENVVNFSMFSQFITSFQWGFIWFGAICAVVFTVLFVEQAIELIRIMVG